MFLLFFLGLDDIQGLLYISLCKLLAFWTSELISPCDLCKITTALVSQKLNQQENEWNGNRFEKPDFNLSFLVEPMKLHQPGSVLLPKGGFLTQGYEI